MPDEFLSPVAMISHTLYILVTLCPIEISSFFLLYMWFMCTTTAEFLSPIATHTLIYYHVVL